MDGGRNQDIRGFFAYFLSLKESRGQAFCERKRRKYVIFLNSEFNKESVVVGRIFSVNHFGHYLL